MTLDEALHTARTYRDARANLPQAIRVLNDAGIPQTRIAAETGLSRDGIRGILNRETTTTEDQP